MKSSRLSPSPCPYCHKVCDAASNVTEPDHNPNPDDWSVCLYCGGLLRFDPFLRLTKGSVTDLLGEPEAIRDMVLRAQRIAREMASRRAE